jgi:hypothetical protein
MSHDLAAAIDVRCQEEERRRAALPYIENGQIADSYDTLHGVRFISLILDTMPPSLSDETRLCYVLYLHDLFLLQTLKALVERATQALSIDAVDAAADHLNWACRLLQLKHDSDGVVVSPISETTKEPAARALVEAFDTLSAALFDRLQTHSGEKSPVLGLASDADARLFHLSKTMILQMKETILINRAPPAVLDVTIVDAHRRCVAAASQGLDLQGDTYLNQFCLLHQLPELLTPLVLRSFDIIETALDARDLSAALSAARLGGDVIRLIISSLWPLIELLYPAQYYAFRANLGATSGSSSAAIRGKLLTAAYIRLANATVAWTAQTAETQIGTALTLELTRIRSLIYRWRGLHMALPRNVLGSDGTKSLMGSPDALKAAEAMAETFHNKDPLSSLFGSTHDRSFAASSATAVLDRWLLSTTGKVAQQRFRQVQERTGAWRRMPKNLEV